MPSKEVLYAYQSCGPERWRLDQGLEWLGQAPGEPGQEQAGINLPQKEKMNSEECDVKDRADEGGREGESEWQGI